MNPSKGDFFLVLTFSKNGMQYLRHTFDCTVVII